MKKTKIAESITFLRKKRGYSQKDIADLIGVTKQAISMYECGERTLSPELIEKFADIYGVDINVIYGRNNEDTDNELMESYGLRPVKLKRFPVLGEIACGQPIYADEEHSSYIDASAEIEADFCLTAKGDSMTGARINNGDVVFIKKQSIVDNGEIAAVVIDGEATLKRWYYYPDKHKLVLNPENSAYEPLVYINEELNTITCIGKAVCFMSNLSRRT